jgi:hypothetical protein
VAINVDLRPKDQQAAMYRIEGDEARRGLSLLEKYGKRGESNQIEGNAMDGLTYFDFLRLYTHKAPYKLRPRALPRVLNYFPMYKPEDVENFGRAELMLHHPFRDVNDLLEIPEIHYGRCTSFAEAYQDCAQLCNHPADGLDEPVVEALESVHEDAEDDPNADDVEGEWEEELDVYLIVLDSRTLIPRSFWVRDLMILLPIGVHGLELMSLTAIGGSSSKPLTLLP